MRSDKKKLRLSKSKVKTYFQCPYRFYVTSVEGWVPDVKSPYLVKGEELHELFDNHFKQQSTSTKIPKEYENHMKNFYEFNKWTKKSPLFHEVRITDEKENFAGIIDRVQTLPNGKTLLLDYKTGKRHERYLDNYLYELGMYSYLYNKKTGLTPDLVGIFFTDAGLIDTWKLTKKIVRDALRKTKKASDEINKKLLVGKKCFRKKKGKLCDFCELYINGKCEGNDKKQ